jgi:hypothetical protein
LKTTLALNVRLLRLDYLAEAAKDTFSQRIAGFLTRLSVTKGKLYASQASIPPSSGRTLVIPLTRSSSATRALVASLGHEQ